MPRLEVYVRVDEKIAIQSALRDPRILETLREDVLDRWAEPIENELDARTGEGGRLAKFMVGSDIAGAVRRLAARAALKYGSRRTLKLVLLAAAAELGYFKPVGEPTEGLKLKLPEHEIKALSKLSPLQRSNYILSCLSSLRPPASCNLDGRPDVVLDRLSFTESAVRALEDKARELGTTVNCVVHMCLSGQALPLAASVQTAQQGA